MAAGELFEPIVRLLDSRLNLTDVVPLWQAVQDVSRQLGPAPADPDKAAAFLAEIEQQIVDPGGVTQQHPDWRLPTLECLAVFRRAIDRERLYLSDVLSAIRVCLVAHVWHIDMFGVDCQSAFRIEVFDWLVRLTRELEPTSWEAIMLAPPTALAPPPRPSGATLIYRRRRRLGWTQAHLAAAVGVDRATVIRWEQGESTPTLTNAGALARELGGAALGYLS